MEREVYSTSDYGCSYPPHTQLSRQSKRRLNGYEKNTFGDFPEPAYSSSAPRNDDTGFDRISEYPVDSSMQLQYDVYKQYAEAAAEGASKYKKLLKSYRDGNKRRGLPDFSNRQHNILGRLAWVTCLNFRQNSKLRQQFNENHVGRRTKNFYDKHADHARKQYMAYEKFRLQSDYHNRSIGKDEYIHADDELW